MTGPPIAPTPRRGTGAPPPGHPAAGWTVPLPSSELTIVKLAPDGHEAARYPARVMERPAPAGWLATRATWAHGEMNIDGLWMMPGDTLAEYFSATEWFNAFAVIAPSGAPRGWYANVTYPAMIAGNPKGLTLYWHDLYVDVIVLPTGVVTVRDEDELAASGLFDQDARLYDHILAGRDRLLQTIREGAYPFDQRGQR